MAIRRAVDGDARHVLMGGQEAPHSRVVSCTLDLPSGGPNQFSVTDLVGQRCWLLGVRLWFFPEVETPLGACVFRLFTGTTRISTEGDMLGWEEVLPLRDRAGQRVEWRRYDGSGPRVWSMNTFYRGESRRFGVWGYRIGEVSSYIWASFEVSEE